MKDLEQRPIPFKLEQARSAGADRDVVRIAGAAHSGDGRDRRFGDRATLRAGLHNLTDRTYWNWSDVRGLEPDEPMLPYLSQAGRSASVSLNVNW